MKRQSRAYFGHAGICLTFRKHFLDMMELTGRENSVRTAGDRASSSAIRMLLDGYRAGSHARRCICMVIQLRGRCYDKHRDARASQFSGQLLLKVTDFITNKIK